jgi:hypothetical protein
VHGVGFGFGRFAQGVVVGAEFAVERVSMFHAVMIRACSTATSARIGPRRD